jgi:hypothetical protein
MSPITQTERRTMTITWQDLRRVAETAQGWQEHDVGILLDAKGKPKAEKVVVGRQYFFVIRGKAAEKRSPLKVLVPNVRFKSVTPRPDGDVAALGDALFWRMAAVEKFLLPYYAGFVDLNEVASAIRRRFEDPEVLAILHLPDSEPDDGTRKLLGLPASELPPGSLAELVAADGGVTVQPFTFRSATR